MSDNDHPKIDFEMTNIPDIALGTTIPHGVQRIIDAEKRARKAERKADLYFIGGLLGTLAGTILGWLLSKFC